MWGLYESRGPAKTDPQMAGFLDDMDPNLVPLISYMSCISEAMKSTSDDSFEDGERGLARS